jgi:tryptophan synthase alpha chain
MSRIAEKFKELQRKGEGALIGYLTLGDPSISASKKLIRCLLENVDILELGIPFTDPIADGPTIQAAIDRSLRSGMNTDIAFDMVAELRADGINTPLIFMTYYNIVLQYGEERFVKKCSQVGVDGLIVCDLPIEEADNLLRYCEENDVDFIFLIAPTTTEERMEKIVSRARGFVYLISLLGVTGARGELQQRTIEVTKWASKYVRTPLAVGFGISKREHVKAVLEAGAQGVVVGSAFVDLIAKKGEKACEDLKRLSAELKEGTRGVSIAAIKMPKVAVENKSG